MSCSWCQVCWTRVCPSKFTALLAACLVLGGCFGQVLQQPASHRSAAPSTPAPLAVTRGALTSATGCELQYRLYRPRKPAADGLVVLGHGFLRNQARMADLASTLANAGMATATLDFCNMRPWDGGHYRNGLDMVRLADRLDARAVVYVGFSAGGLAAVAAASADPRSRGVVALDLVDADGLGERLARGLQVPLVGLVGEPSACNAMNNGLAVYAATPAARLQRIRGADHCDFESPTDWLCRLVCDVPEATTPDPRSQPQVPQALLSARQTPVPLQLARSASLTEQRPEQQSQQAHQQQPPPRERIIRITRDAVAGLLAAT